MSKTRRMSGARRNPPSRDHARGVPLKARGLSHSYRSAHGSINVLADVDLDVEAGDYVALSGPSGAGKTTLLSLLGGLERPCRGAISVGDVDVTDLMGDDLAAYRRETVGFVFQHFGLLETLSAQENIELACALAGVSSSARARRARTLLEAVGLAARASNRPGQLSGGERQRVAIARALANHPRLVLADEPTGNLDEESAELVVGLLETLQQRWGYTLLIVTHNRAVAQRAAARLSLERARLVAS
jgi:putative ABC transport system ATP-binding protein